MTGLVNSQSRYARMILAGTERVVTPECNSYTLSSLGDKGGGRGKREEGGRDGARPSSSQRIGDAEDVDQLWTGGVSRYTIL